MCNYQNLLNNKPEYLNYEVDELHRVITAVVWLNQGIKIGDDPWEIPEYLRGQVELICDTVISGEMDEKRHFVVDLIREHPDNEL